MVTDAVVAYGPPMPIAVLAPQGPVWQWLIVGTNIPRGVFPRGISWIIKSKWLLGWQIHTWVPQPSCLHLMISHGLGDRVGSKVAGFPTHIPTPVSRNAASLVSSKVRPTPVNVFHKKELPYPDPLLLLQ